MPRPLNSGNLILVGMPSRDRTCSLNPRKVALYSTEPLAFWGERPARHPGSQPRHGGVDWQVAGQVARVPDPYPPR